MAANREGPVAGIVLAGGSSVRMGADKLWEALGDRPVIEWSIRAFAGCSSVDVIVVVSASGSERRMNDLVAVAAPGARVVKGGAERQDSVRAGLDACPEATWVVVHDGARPLVTCEMIERGLAAAVPTGAAIAAVPVVDTIKLVEGDVIRGTPPREALWAAQTPQVFRRLLLLEAHDRATGVVSDDAALVEALGVAVRVFPGAYGNIKITTPVDLRIAESLLAASSSGRPTPGDEAKR
ncbi:MAG TPA: 2-C-methyl-D-erythritol 4-phosphate cytidylyltransferase [Chloroflexota bacterium]|nr:2-C-methyl-D-erythritol 4-phosphate cytidylyltransferase [Chloroflexota bacterium]